MNSQRGFTMVELIVTLAILSFGIISVYGAFTPLLYLTSNINSRLKAAYLAQEGIEIVRNIRDNNVIHAINDPEVAWSDGLLECNLGCQADYKTTTAVETFDNQLKLYNDDMYLSLNAEGFYSYDQGGAPTKFRRNIIIEQDDGNSDALRVLVVVSWDYNNQLFQFNAEGYLYNWY